MQMVYALTCLGFLCRRSPTITRVVIIVNHDAFVAWHFLYAKVTLQSPARELGIWYISTTQPSRLSFVASMIKARSLDILTSLNELLHVCIADRLSVLIRSKLRRRIG